MFRAHLALTFMATILGALIGIGNKQGPSFAIAGFFAPILGPWSLIFEPHAKVMGRLSQEFLVITFSAMVMLFVTMKIAYFGKPNFLRNVAIFFSFLSLVFWLLFGLADALNSTF